MLSALFQIQKRDCHLFLRVEEELYESHSWDIYLKKQ